MPKTPRNIVAERENTTIKVDGLSRRTASDALEGHFAYVKGGEHDGRYVVFLRGQAPDANNYPTEALVRARDDKSDTFTVPYASLIPAQAGHR